MIMAKILFKTVYQPKEVTLPFTFRATSIGRRLETGEMNYVTEFSVFQRAKKQTFEITLKIPDGNLAPRILRTRLP